MYRTRFVVAIAGAILSWSSGERLAFSDRLESTLDQPLREISHAVDVSVVDGIATYTVRRSFANRGKRHDEAMLWINLPYGAAATGLRIRSGKRWYKGDLLKRDVAAERYEKLTGLGAAIPRDPALLQWVWTDQLRLQLFPIPPEGTATVEYTLTSPTNYAGGRYSFSYARHDGSETLAVPVIRVLPQQSKATMFSYYGHAKVNQR